MKAPGHNDTYKTLAGPGREVLYKDRNSKFYGYAFPLAHEDAASPLLEEVRKRHRKASPLCYAWQWGLEEPYYRVNDDGEPTHSAGMPIYGQIQAFGLTNVLVAVLRIYGGTKLGVGGLIQAYRETGKMALEASEIVTRTLKGEFLVHCGYPQLNTVLRLVKVHNMELLQQELQESCTFHIAVRLQNAEKTETLFQNIQGVRVVRV